MGVVQKQMGKYKAIDLFAGIGGIRMGFDRAFGDNVETVFVSELDEPACKTYRANFDDPFDIAGDITKIDASEVPDFDICLAGFPCQAFSLAGRRKGFDDDYRGRARGTLFFDTLRICADRENKPKVIFCENVKGLPIHDKGRTLKTILGALREDGYIPFYEVLNSKNFGVPQNRERIYIVAFREDIAPESFSFPTHAGEKKVIADILEDAPISPKYYLSDVYLETLRRHRAHHESLGHGFGYEIRELDGIAGTIVCGGMGRERNLIVDHREHSMVPVTRIKGEINKEDIRKMTPREWARLQGFPDSFKLTLSDTQLYKQFGNSVTVPVITAIAKRIKEVLDASGKSE
ncbi:MAG: DNA (cytosine-5-)-methyltransferase [Adlercreutzia sp.]|nr:DNA (cytosine-5-)-methyltransferase [Adlercreutzia sp.]